MEKNELIDIMNDFAKDGIIFSNEAYFKFSLAQEIRKKLPDTNIYFEVLACDKQIITAIKSKTKEQLEKKYIDLLIEDKKEWFAIELKYLMPQKFVHMRHQRESV